MVVQQCKFRNSIPAFLTGSLDDDLHESIAAHIEDCDDCRQTIQKQDLSGDRLVAVLAEAALTSCEAQSERIKGLVDNLQRDQFLLNAETQDFYIPNQLGHYLILDEIGSGGMSIVFRGRHTLLQREVAIKFLRLGRHDAQSLARLRREIAAIGKLDHANIVRATDADEVNGVPYLVMELVDGPDLGKVLKRQRQLPIADACEIACKTAEGLQHAYENGFVHRDIKPSNVLLTSKGEVKLVDLGLAILAGHGEPRLTESCVTVGTPDYMPPEQWQDARAVDIRSDIYSLGCTIYQMLCGNAPFQSEQYSSNASKMHAHLTTPVPRIEELRSDVPAELSVIILKCLEKLPEHRFATPRELVRSLQPFCSGACLSRIAAEAQHLEAESIDTQVPVAQPSTVTLTRKQQPSERRWFFKATWLVFIVSAIGIIASQTRFFEDSSSALGFESLKITHFRFDEATQTQTRIGFLEDQIESVRLGDELQLDISTNQPATVLVIGLSPDGAAEVAGILNTKDGNARLPALNEEYIRLDRGVGQQGFVCLICKNHATAQSIASDLLSNFPWSSEGQKGVWEFSKGGLRQLFPEDERPRGTVVSRTSEAFKTFCQAANRMTGVDDLKAYAFYVYDL